MNASERSVIVGVVVLIMGCSDDAAAQSPAPYQFNGIVLDSPETELPKAYKAAFREADCYPDRLGQKPVRQCRRDFLPHALPGLPPGINGPVHFYLNYVDGRLQQIGLPCTGTITLRLLPR